MKSLAIMATFKTTIQQKNVNIQWLLKQFLLFLLMFFWHIVVFRSWDYCRSPTSYSIWSQSIFEFIIQIQSIFIFIQYSNSINIQYSNSVKSLRLVMSVRTVSFQRSKFVSQFLSLVLSRVRQDVTVLHFSGVRKAKNSWSGPKVRKNGSKDFLDTWHKVRYHQQEKSNRARFLK